MRRLYVEKFERKQGLKAVPVLLNRQKFALMESGYDKSVKRSLEKIKEELVDFRDFSYGKNPNEPEVRSRFNGIIDRMSRFLQENGCFYPDSLARDVISLGIENGGSIFAILFQANNVRQDIERMSKNCKFLIQ